MICEAIEQSRSEAKSGDQFTLFFKTPEAEGDFINQQPFLYNHRYSGKGRTAYAFPQDRKPRAVDGRYSKSLLKAML